MVRTSTTPAPNEVIRPARLIHQLACSAETIFEEFAMRLCPPFAAARELVEDALGEPRERVEMRNLSAQILADGNALSGRFLQQRAQLRREILRIVQREQELVALVAERLGKIGIGHD